MYHCQLKPTKIIGCNHQLVYVRKHDSIEIKTAALVLGRGAISRVDMFAFYFVACECLVFKNGVELAAYQFIDPVMCMILPVHLNSFEVHVLG